MVDIVPKINDDQAVHNIIKSYLTKYKHAFLQIHPIWYLL